MNKPVFINIPVIEQTAEAWEEARLAEINADAHGNNPDMVHFENSFQWYLHENRVRQAWISVEISRINHIRQAWVREYCIISHGMAEDHIENIVPMTKEQLEEQLREHIEFTTIEI